MRLSEEDGKMLMPWAVALTTLATHGDLDEAREMLFEIVFDGSDNPEQSTTRALGLIDTFVQWQANSVRNISDILDEPVEDLLAGAGLQAAKEE